jgi:hypothetical protein
VATERKTLLQLMKDRAEAKERAKEIECPVENPLQLRFNSMVSFALAEQQDNEYRVRTISEVVRDINHERHVFVDYELRQPESENVLKLRAQDNRYLLLSAIDSFGYNEGFKEVLDEALDLFTVTNPDGSTNDYARINHRAQPWHANVTAIEDKDGDGKMTGNDPVLQITMSYWDFEREVIDEAGQKHLEYLFAEMDKESGWFTLWLGNEIDASQILII